MEFTTILLGQEFGGQFYDFGLTTSSTDSFSYASLNSTHASQLANASGIDTIVLLGGDDTATDDDSSRIYFGNAGRDTIDGAGGDDTIAGGRDYDSIVGGAGADVLAGNIGNDTISGGSGADVLLGGQDNDILDGGSDNDLLSGDRGNDTLTGGSGLDTLTGGGGRDIFVLESGNGVDTITDFVTGDDRILLPGGMEISSIRFMSDGSGDITIESNGVALAIVQNATFDDLSGQLVQAPNGDPDTFEARVLALTNEFRRSNGVADLTANTNLTQAAETHSQNMADQDFYSHTGADGSSVGDRAQAAGYGSSFVGENIAAGSTSPEAVVEAWINSPGHRANMLNERYTELGVGYVFLADDTGSVTWNHYWTQVFG